jgi:hypothetical protein
MIPNLPTTRGERTFVMRNLSFAQLMGANLEGANLDRAHLSSANLEGANLIHANLGGANLSFAQLIAADLSGPNLGVANLSGANLDVANLSGASLFAANLNSADLANSDLRGANLGQAQVSKAKLDHVDLTDSVYAPASEPPAPYVAGIKGLAATKAARGEEIGLVQLRKLLRDAGLSDSAREATCSIQRNITRDQLRQFPYPACVMGVLRVIGFDCTTAYGLHPEWALGWIVLLGAALTPAYMRAILRPTAESGIVQVFPAGRLDGTAGDPAEEQKPKKQLAQEKGWRGALRAATYFSLLSAVNIGFEQFTPGDWIRRLQKREYSLEAVGWVRVVAGTQALISVYLLAMWVLTQFGQPFE